VTVINRWAIRQRSTGHYIPAPKGRGGRGGTHEEPCDPLSPGGEPRLFCTEHAAKVALTCWLNGKVTVSIYSDDWISGYGESWHVEPVPSRNRDDMEVVAVRVELP